MKITELMTQPAVTCSTSDDLDCAAQLMWEHDCGALPVVDGDGRTVGVITDRDICMAVWTQGRTLPTIPVRAAMSKQVFACRADDTLEAVRRTMQEKRIRRVPIVDAENRPVGMLSLNDLAQTLASSCQRQFLATTAAAGSSRP
jgi:CBS domain-containing protein